LTGGIFDQLQITGFKDKTYYENSCIKLKQVSLDATPSILAHILSSLIFVLIFAILAFHFDAMRY